jgi:hypothetical protein
MFVNFINSSVSVSTALFNPFGIYFSQFVVYSLDHREPTPARKIITPYAVARNLTTSLLRIRS